MSLIHTRGKINVGLCETHGTYLLKGKKAMPKSMLESLLNQLNTSQEEDLFDLKLILKKREREKQYMDEEEAFMRFLYELSK